MLGDAASLHDGPEGRYERTESKDAIKADLVISKAPKVAMARALQSTIGLEESIRAWQQE